jgi:hypothetical protein
LDTLFLSASSLSIQQENEVDENYTVIPCTLSSCDVNIDTHVLMNCGCTGLSFTNKDFSHEYNLLHYQLKPPKTIKVIDGYPISCTEIAKYLHIDYTTRGTEAGQSEDSSRVKDDSEDRGQDRDDNRDRDEDGGKDVEVPNIHSGKINK